MKRAMKRNIALAEMIVVIVALTAIITTVIAQGVDPILWAVIAIMVGSGLTCIFLTYGLLLYKVTTAKE